MLERTIKPFIEEISRGFRVVLLNGQRQVGKSTLIESMAAGERRYVSLDNIKFRNLAQSDPELFIRQNPPPVIIDEVQYAPELFTYIKIYADTHKNEKGAFWLTGSQKFKLMKGVQESLAGRIAILDLLGLSYREKIRKPKCMPFLPDMEPNKTVKKVSPLELYTRIWEGALPEPVVDKRLDREVFYGSYVQSYIERDVRDFYNVEKPLQFYDFLRVVAARTGNLVNYASLAKDIGIDLKTAQTWMGILERSGIVFLLHPYSPNVTKRIIKTPKVYFLDTGLAAYLCRWSTADTLMNGAMDGQILETYCLGEILKSYSHNGREPLLYFYRDADQKEVNFIIEENMTLYPVEVKKTANPDNNCIKSFRVLEKLGKKVGTGAVLCLQPERIPLDRGTVSIPVWEI
ncbi:ATPase [Spirochaetia bacterium]|nr:ATPase [Spirochaetia bacterium]